MLRALKYSCAVKNKCFVPETISTWTRITDIQYHTLLELINYFYSKITYYCLLKVSYNVIYYTQNSDLPRN